MTQLTVSPGLAEPAGPPETAVEFVDVSVPDFDTVDDAVEDPAAAADSGAPIIGNTLIDNVAATIATASPAANTRNRRLG